MKSKAHNKKCIELNIHPVPTSIEDCNDENFKLDTVPGDESDDETDEDDDDDEDDETEDEGIISY